MAIMTGTAAMAADEAQAKPAEVIAALVAKPPGVLSELEAIIGPLHRDPVKWEDAVGPLHRLAPGPGVAKADVELGIDTYHEDPRKVTDPSVIHWSLDFLADRDACRQLLAARFPAPRKLRDGGRRVLRFGDFYFSELDVAGGFRLAWYRREPLFSIPERSERETVKLVSDLAAVANAGFTRRTIAAHLGPLTYDRQIERDVLLSPTWRLEYAPAGAAKPKDFYLVFKRPLPSRGLLPRLGITRPAVRSNDVHMQGRTIVDLDHPVSPETGYSSPALRGYVIEIEVYPKGLTEIDEHFPFSLAWSAEGSQIFSIRAWLPPHPP
jgi:hypothetical protein